MYVVDIHGEPKITLPNALCAFHILTNSCWFCVK